MNLTTPMFTIHLDEFFFIFSALTLLLLSVGWLTVRLSRLDKNRLFLQQELVRLEDLLHAQTTVASGMSRALSRVEQQHQSLTKSVEQAETGEQLIAGAGLSGGAQVYRQAINLAVDGVAPQELADRFGLSRGEAELMVSFHQLNDQAA